MLDNLKFFSLIALVIAGIIALGWRQPLKYRFMSQAEIYAAENPTTPTPFPVEAPTPWMWDKSRGTTLDRKAVTR